MKRLKTVGSIVSLLLPTIGLAQGQFHLQEATINDIHAAIKSGEITCQGLVQAYVNRAKAYNGMCTELVTKDGANIPQALGAMRAGIPNAGQLNALETLNIRGERSVSCKAMCDAHPSSGPLAKSCPAMCEAFRQQP